MSALSVETPQTDLNDAWSQFMNGTWDTTTTTNTYYINNDDNDTSKSNMNKIMDSLSLQNIIDEDVEQKMFPKCGDIYISTQTRIAYINKPVNLNEVFWQIPVIEYASPINGVINKQMKFVSHSKEEQDELIAKTEGSYNSQFTIRHIDNPSGATIKYKDERKISVGVCKKDILSYRCKKKGAFYNCFVLIFRIRDEHGINGRKPGFCEIHVKVFNTGKLEIPGIRSGKFLNKVLDLLLVHLKPILGDDLEYTADPKDIVLINSNFVCGYYINRQQLYNILRFKYNLPAIYDPCSYPGIQCKFHYNYDTGEVTDGKMSSDENITQRAVSFMIFRTGSVLIVGKCTEEVLRRIYTVIKSILETEYPEVNTGLILEPPKEKRKKIKRVMIKRYTDELEPTHTELPTNAVIATADI